MTEDALVNTGAPSPARTGWGRVLGIQTKLHGLTGHMESRMR
jgi:hypothetical protein